MYYNQLVLNSQINIFRIDFLISFVLTFVLLIVTCRTLVKAGQVDDATFGYEYAYIAESLVNNLGFSSPFGTKIDANSAERILNASISNNNLAPDSLINSKFNGLQLNAVATAWMPPFYVLIIAIFFKLFGVYTIHAAVMLLMTKIIFIGCAIFLTCNFLYRNNLRLELLLFTGFLIVFFNLLPPGVQKLDHDIPIQMAAITFVVISLLRFIQEDTKESRILFVISCIISVFTNPVLFFAQYSSILFLLFRGKFKDRLKTLSITIILTCICLFGWWYRCKQLVGVNAVIKSNFWYEFYQANVLDTNGIPGNATFLSSHPTFNKESLLQYLDLKEAGFISVAKDRSLKWLAENKSLYIKKALSRFRNAFIYLEDQLDLQPIEVENLYKSDLEHLIKLGLIQVNYRSSKAFWVSLDLSESEFLSKIKESNLISEGWIYLNWLDAQRNLQKQRSSTGVIILGLLFALLPSLAIFFALFNKQLRSSWVFITLSFFYICFLSSFALISHYNRYQYPLFMIQALIFSFLCSAYVKKICFR